VRLIGWMGCWLMADGIFFNHGGVTHDLMLELFDKPTTWRAVVDGSVEVFFDASTDADIIDLVDAAVEAWLEERP
jgi:hypothetical protein